MISKNCRKRISDSFQRLARYALPVFLLFLSYSSFASLPSFTLVVTKTDETCLGNGSLSFSTSGTATGATVTFYVYQLPDTTNPIAVQTTTFLGGRTSATYQVVAVQTLGSEQNSQSTTIAIHNQIVPLNYTITSTNSICNDGTINVNITNGIGSQYEIIAGPITKPLQNSPFFDQLPPGVYQIRVYDSCGDASVVTHTVLSTTPNLTIGSVTFPSLQLPTCNSILVANALTAGPNQTIRYPLALTYVVHFPNGLTQNFTETVANGMPGQHIASIEIPFFYNQSYSYDLTVVDGCGNTYTLEDNIVFQQLSASISGQNAACGTYFLTVGASFYGGNLQIQFTSFPAGFDPIAFLSTHPGPFAGPTVDYGSFSNPVPYGQYEVVISDGCGHSATAVVNLVFQPAVPSHESDPWPGCQSNISDVTIVVPTHTIEIALIIAAPAAYTNPLPQDVSAFINADGELELTGLITGNYTVELEDECGNTYTYDFFVADVATSLATASWPSCELGKGSIRIRGNNTLLTSVIITSAPLTFTPTLPFDASSYISTSSVFSMIDLLPGNYSFTVNDNCGIEHQVTITVVGYTNFSSSYSVTPHCGSFDLHLQHNSNAVSQQFWLQKFNPSTNSWEHPATGVDYINGDQPNGNNSYLVQNNIPTLNIVFLGTFRILKSFQTFDNGNLAAFKTCIEIIDEFEFTNEIQFTGIEKTNCNGLYMNIQLFAIGIPPLIYSIVEKNGQPFVVNNGTNNQFNNLEPAIYTFRVEQLCGDSRNFISDVAQLPSLATANQPNSMWACDDNSNNGKELFDLSTQNASILGSQNPSLYAITYHLSINEAVTNTNPLPFIYLSGNATIYCRLQYLNVSDCFDVTSFELIVNPYPTNTPQDIHICQGSPTTITALSGFTSYQWSTGETGQSIIVTEAGQYTVTVVKDYPAGSCTGQLLYNVTASSAPEITQLITVDWTDTENSIEVILNSNGLGNYVYSIDGLHFQESPIFYGLEAGEYAIIVKDTFGCGIDQATVHLLNYPKYFTPNGDGIHDYWNVKNARFEPNLYTYIFDRFGKLITGFDASGLGWDGKLNGQPLPATDYWFVVIRQDGREHRGHFTLKR